MVILDTERSDWWMVPGLLHDKAKMLFNREGHDETKAMRKFKVLLHHVRSGHLPHLKYFQVRRR